jgi:membrane-bound serine protease (ClpP class)
MLILGGIYFELQSPGIGFPLIIAIGASILYFAPLYIDGLAENWEIALFIVGIILIALEIFVIPGFGIAGISGGLFAFMGLLLSMINNINFDFSPVKTEPLIIALTTTSLAFLLGASLSLWLTNKFWGRGALQHLSLDSEQNREEGFVAVDLKDKLINREGTAVTDLRPSGKIMIDGHIYDAVALIGLIDKDTKVRVTKQESAQLYVMKSQAKSL